MFEALQAKLDELSKEVKKLKELDQKKKVELGPLVIKCVLPGDVWCYLKNRHMKNNGLCKVISVNKRKNHVALEYGWNPLDNMLSDSNWILVSRPFTPQIKKLVMKL